jgi:RNA polymerase sigma factor (sigma-70 family)
VVPVAGGETQQRAGVRASLVLCNHARIPDINLVVAQFEELYRAYAPAVRAYARRRVDAGSADDVVADVFLVVWRRLDDLPEEPLPWLLGVARGVLANRRRGDARTVALRERLAGERPGTVELVDRDDRVFHALAALSARDRELLLLVAWEGLEPAAAARVLGVRVGTFAVRLHRARRRFARRLAALDTEPLPARGRQSRLEVP